MQISLDSSYARCVSGSVVASWSSTGSEHQSMEIDVLWTVFFSMPMFLISKVLSNFFFQDIADAGYGTPTTPVSIVLAVLE